MTIIGLVVLVLLVMLVVGLAKTRNAAREARIRAAAAVGDATVVRSEDVRSLGQAATRGRGDRGNGTLVLTERELIFARWVPAEDLVVPRRAIRDVDVTRRHAGKAVARDVVAVRFRVGGGQDDTIAFHSPDPQAWLVAFGAMPR